MDAPFPTAWDDLELKVKEVPEREYLSLRFRFDPKGPPPKVSALDAPDLSALNLSDPTACPLADPMRAHLALRLAAGAVERGAASLPELPGFERARRHAVEARCGRDPGQPQGRGKCYCASCDAACSTVHGSGSPDDGTASVRCSSGHHSGGRVRGE